LNKKAALELSMNTIVIIVIGVTILSLGLVFVNKMFSGITDINKDAMDNARNKVSQITSDDLTKPVTVVPNKMDIGKGENSVAGVVFKNEETQAQAFSATVTSQKSYVKCTFTDSGKQTSNTYNVASGETASTYVTAEVDKTAPLGLAVCNIKANGGKYTDDFIITVIA
jgi:hypothetical protein